ncbi:MAG: N-acetyltransferase [Ramlibacter sp.]|nr:N-acetyltransferase [Ramlibacter sp.]
MRMISCTQERHSAPILAIFNDAILNSTALYDYKPRTLESIVGWFKVKEQNRFPVVGVEDDAGELLGFASYGTFRAWPAYKYSVEHSVYIRRDHRGRGLGSMIMRSLIEEARKQGYHMMVGGIDVKNEASIRLHTQLGFTPCGIVKQAGFKFGTWLDLAFYQLIFDTPADPHDD